LITGLGYAFTGQAQGKRALVNKLAQGLYRLALDGSHHVFFQNFDDQKLFSERGLIGASSKSSVVAGSGIDIDSFEKASFQGESVVFLLIARLLGDKGVREYIAAARCVKEKHADVQFHLVGWIDENPDAIAQHELDGWVSEGVVNYLGRLSDVRPAIENCSVYVLPSYREGTPRTVLEAMAMGRAIITTDAPGCRETVVDGDNGFLVPVRSFDALVEAMIRFIEQPDLVVKIDARSRQIAEEKYDVHKVNEVMLREMGVK